MTLEKNLLSKALIQTNPKLTGNVKVTIDSTNKIWLNSIDANDSLSQTNFKRFPIRSNENYPTVLNRFLLDGKVPSNVFYEIKEETNPTNLKKSLDEQLYQFYTAGVSFSRDKNYTEDFKCFAPLYINKILPTHFVIFKVPGAYTKSNNVASENLVPNRQYMVVPSSSIWSFTYNGTTYDNTTYPTGLTFTAIVDQAYTYTGELIVTELSDLDLDNYVKNPKNFNKEFLQKATIIKTFDLVNSPVGQFLNNCINDSQFPDSPLEINFEADKLSYWKGASYVRSVYTNIGEDLSSFYSAEKPLKSQDEYISLGFERNSLVYPNIFNFEFLFNDPEDDNWTFNRYFGLYVIENEVGQFTLDGDNYYRFTDFTVQTPVLTKPKNFGYYYMSRPANVSNDSGIELYVNPNDKLTKIIQDDILSSESVFIAKGRSGQYQRIKTTEVTDDYNQIKLFTKDYDISDFTGFEYNNPTELHAELLGPNGSAALCFTIIPTRLEYAFPKPNGGFNLTYKTGIEYGSIIEIDWLNSKLPLKINDVSALDVNNHLYEPLRQIDPTNRTLKFPKNVIETRVMGYHMYSTNNGTAQILLDPVVNPGQNYDTAFCQWADDLPANNLLAADIIANSIANALNALPYSPFYATSIKDTVYVVINSPGTYYNGSIFSTTLNPSRYSLYKNQNYFGGGSDTVKRVKITKTDASQIDVNDWMKTIEGYSQIVSISPYVEEPIYDKLENLIGYKDVDQYVVVTIKDGTPVMSDNKIQIFKPLQSKFSLLSFLDIMNFDSSFNISTYNRSLSYESERYQQFDNVNKTNIYPIELEKLAGDHQDETIPMKWMSNLNDNWFGSLDLTTLPTTNPEIYNSLIKLNCLTTYSTAATTKLPVLDRITGNPSIPVESYVDASNPVFLYPFEDLNIKWYQKEQTSVYTSSFISRINMPTLTSSLNESDFKSVINLTIENSDLQTIYKINDTVKNIKFSKINNDSTIEIFNVNTSDYTDYDSLFNVNLNPELNFDSKLLKNFLYNIYSIYDTNYAQFKRLRYYIIRYTYNNLNSYYLILDPDLANEFLLEGDGLELYKTPICITDETVLDKALIKYDDWTPFLKAEYETLPENILSDTTINTYGAYSSNNNPISLTSNETTDFIGFNHLNNVITDNYILAEKQNEYDRLEENYLQQFNYVSQVVPYINKWAFVGSTDIRSNPYRLNGSLSFGILNFSPSYSNFDSNTEYFTHEWPYLAEYPINYPDEFYDKAFNYIGIGKTYEVFKQDLLNESTDFFVKTFSKKANFDPNKEDSIYVRTLPNDLFSIVSWAQETGATTVFRGVKLKFNERLKETKLVYDSNVPVVANSNKYEGYKFTAVLFLKEKSNKFAEKSDVNYEYVVNDKFKNITFIIRVSIEDYKLKSINFNQSNSIDYFNLYNLKSQKKIQRKEIVYDDVLINGSIIWNFNNKQYRLVKPVYIDSSGIYHVEETNLIEILNYNRNFLFSPLVFDQTSINNPTLNDFILTSRLLDRSNLIVEFDQSDKITNSILLGYRQTENLNDTVNPTFRYFDSNTWYMPSNGSLYPLFTYPDAFIDGTVVINENIITINDNGIGDESVQKVFLNKSNGQYIRLTYSNNDLYNTVYGDSLTQISDYAKLDHYLVYPNGGYEYNQSIINQLSFASINDLIEKNSPKINYSYSNNSMRKLWIQTETPVEVNLRSTVTISEDPVKPNNLMLEPIVGYVTQSVSNNINIYRFSGAYDIILKPVINFDETTNNSIIYANSKFDIDSPNFGMYEKWIYKVSTDPNILKSTNYPLINEYAIDRVDEYIFKSQWDQEFFRMYTDKTTFNLLQGSRTMTEIQLPLTSKCVQVVEGVRIETINTNSITITVEASKLIVSLDIRDSIKRYIADQLRTEFNKWVNVNTGEFGSRSNEENLINYIDKNLVDLYTINTVELWQLNNAPQDGVLINLNDSQKQNNGFVRQNRFSSSLLNNILTLNLPLITQSKTLYSLTISFKRI